MEDESARVSDDYVSDTSVSKISSSSCATVTTEIYTESEFVIEIKHETIPEDPLLSKAMNLCVMCDRPATVPCLKAFDSDYQVITPRDVPVTTMSNFVYVASYSLKGMFSAEAINQSLAVLTKGLIPFIPGTVIIAALSWSPERTSPLNLVDVTGRDIVFALEKLRLENVGVCNPDPRRNILPSVPGIKITDFNNPFFARAFGADHGIESLQPVQVLEREIRYEGHAKMFGCTIPFLLGLPWITRADNDPRWVIERRKIEKPINLRYLNFQFDAGDERRILGNIRLSNDEDRQAAPCHYGTFVLVHLLGVKIYPYHISALCDYLDDCSEFTTIPSKEGFLDSWQQWCQAHDGDRDEFISPYDTGNLEEADRSDDGATLPARNL
ncbi:hypothetical protein QR685DRAFT_440158 [Neurospora intermedia]|uniref:HNH nuclease domain-containing protein n=1 Tax=Neurospora intermedia TaxID=5142 RepID=A0ABR3DHE3_NEUIN